MERHESESVIIIMYILIVRWENDWGEIVFIYILLFNICWYIAISLGDKISVYSVWFW